MLPSDLETSFSWFSSISTSHSFSCVLSCMINLQKVILQVRSMGNRPQGSKFAYTATAIFFACLMGYMLFCSAWLTVKGIQATLATLAAENQQFGKDFRSTVAAIFGNRIFRDLIVSTVSTYGLYLISSLLFFDFLHMFTSFIQYLLLSPSYVNILYSLLTSLTDFLGTCTHSVIRTMYHGEQREITQ